MRYFKDSFLTNDLAIRGHVPTGGGRLATFLNAPSRRFIEVADATCVRSAGESLATPRLILQVSDILLAHEAWDAGDEGLKALFNQDSGSTPVTIHLSARHCIEITTRMRKSIYERDDLGERRFIAVTEPSIRGDDHASALLRCFPNPLPYVILNRDHILLIHE
ncbi:MAG: hypothetical protein ABIG68_12065 [Acidobacteriota bacterium]